MQGILYEYANMTWGPVTSMTQTGSSNRYFLLKYMSEHILLYFNLSKPV